MSERVSELERRVRVIRIYNYAQQYLYNTDALDLAAQSIFAFHSTLIYI